MYPALAWGSWLIAEARWERDVAARRSVEIGAERERAQALLNIAAHEAIQRGHTDRVDMFVTAFVDHLDGSCPASGECFAEQTARKALTEYGIEVPR